MARSKVMKVPPEFDEFLDNLSTQISQDLMLPKNKSQTMRLLSRDFKDKLIYKNKRFDIKLFK